MRVQRIDYCDFVQNIGGDTECSVIWFSGCTHKCDGCHNPLLWKSDNNTLKLTVLDILDRLQIWSDSKEVVLLGGEPLEQNRKEFKLLCRVLYNNGFKIWLYTGYDEVPKDILKYLYTVKVGKYDNKLKQRSIIIDGTRVDLASYNQKIIKWRGDYVCI